MTAPVDEAHAPERSPARGCLLEVAETLVLTLIIFFVIQNFVAQPFRVQMSSMEHTFEPDQYVLIDRLSHLWSPYQRGQVIVFRPPESTGEQGDPFIKRVIGVAGDTVELRDGQVFVNGKQLNEPYLYRNDAGDVEPTDPSGGLSSWTVPDGQLFVMGDHRQVSVDSRAFGFVPVTSVIGRAVLRYWPLAELGLVQTPTYAP
ncbi:MAG TPA: signal peptidase I [Candidatus Limnocylindrales bacterium]